MPIRTRFAPSPTGEDAHIGTAYAALVNFAFARKNKGQFIYRSEDTDRERYVPEFETNFKNSMAWLGINWDEGPDVGGPHGPYRQSERLDLYKKGALELTEKSAAYFCFCSKERLESVRRQQGQKGQVTRYDGLCRSLNPSESRKKFEEGESAVIRLKIPTSGQTQFSDVVRGTVVFENSQIDDQVLLKSDGYPTYHLAVVVDDYLMKISHVIRAEEWLSSTPKHVLLYRAFGWPLPVFAHIPILRNPDKSKLSKRKNPVWVSWFRREGFLPEAILNFLALQAWSHPAGKEIFSMAEFIEKFTLERLAKTGPAFDLKKLEWLNGEYIRKNQNSKFKDQILEIYREKYSAEQIEKSWPLIRERMKKLSEFEFWAGFLFKPPKNVDRSQLSHLKLIQKALTGLARPWSKESWEKALRDLAGTLGLKPAEVFMELRLSLSGSRIGPDLFDSIKVMSEAEVLQRLTAFV